MTKIPESVYENFRLAVEQGKLVSIAKNKYEFITETLKIDDPEVLQRLDEDDATWVNHWRVAIAAAEGKLTKLPYESEKRNYSSPKKS